MWWTDDWWSVSITYKGGINTAFLRRKSSSLNANFGRTLKKTNITHTRRNFTVTTSEEKVTSWQYQRVEGSNAVERFPGGKSERTGWHCKFETDECQEEATSKLDVMHWKLQPPENFRKPGEEYYEAGSADSGAENMRATAPSAILAGWCWCRVKTRKSEKRLLPINSETAHVQLLTRSNAIASWRIN